MFHLGTVSVSQIDRAITLGVQEVPSSNLGSPTKFLKELQTKDPFRWPFGVQLESKTGRLPFRLRAVGFRWLLGCFLSALNSPELSTPRKTRQTRQFAANLLIMLIKCVSGSPRNPTRNPTYCPGKPDKSPARPAAHLI